MITQGRGFNVILSVRRENGQRCEALDDFVPRPRPGESLRQFLQDRSSGDDEAARFKSSAQLRDSRGVRVGVAPERERPVAGVDKERHRGERAALVSNESSHSADRVARRMVAGRSASGWTGIRCQVGRGRRGRLPCIIKAGGSQSGADANEPVPAPAQVNR
jgi:hypothetical protein